MKMAKPIQAADLFCGAGGTSTGLLEACRQLKLRLDLVAVNHWPLAIQTHMANHPWARHICASLMPIEPRGPVDLFEGGVDAVDPRKAVPGGKLDLLIGSPECTHHSVARGGRPRSDQSRSTAWCILRWADALRPESVLIENVPEFRTWGPLDDHGRPIASERGRTFEAFLNALDGLGYSVDWKILCAADYGDATTRKRLFIQARRSRRRIDWPTPSHDRHGRDGLARWRAAREIIDWELTGQSIFRRGKPLAPRTLERIEAGLKKFCGKAAEPFLVMLRGPLGQPDRFARSVDEPAPTITAGGTHLGLVQPFLIPQQSKGSPRHVGEPVPTICTKGAIALVQPFVTALAHTQDGPRNRSVDEPLPTVTGTRTYGLVEPFVLPMEGVHRGNAARSVDEPLPTITASRGGGHLVEPYLVKYYRTGTAQPVGEPLDTVTTKPRFGLVEPVVVQDEAGNAYALDIRFRMLQPHELAAAMGFPQDYQFHGTKDQVVKQIGNAVPTRTACALTKRMIA